MDRAAGRAPAVRPGPRRTAGPRSRRRAAPAGRPAAAPPRRSAAARRPGRAPVTHSVTGCSTCSRVFISRNQKVPSSPARGTRPCRRRRSRSPSRRPRPRRDSSARRASSTSGDGVSSMTFWCRRCSEHSRSPSDHTVPCASASTCTSRCRPASTYGSQNTVASPKARRRPRPGRDSIARGQLGEGAHDPHAAAAAAGRRLDQHRQVGLGHRRRVELGQHGHAGGGHQLLGLDLGAHRRDRGRRRADPDQPGVEHGLREVGVLGQEAVAGVDGVGAGGARGVDQQVGAQVGVGRRGAGQPDGAVGLARVRAVGVRVGVDGDGADAEVAAGAEDPAGDLAAVGDQDSGDHGVLTSGRRRSRRLALPAPTPSIARLAIADRHRPSTVRVSRGSMTPSS